MDICRICKEEIDHNKQASFSYESVKNTGNRNHYHQSCLFLEVARKFEEELD